MSLPVPDLPTDNLYKFATIAGIALVGFGVYAVEREAGLKLERMRDIGRSIATAQAHQGDVAPRLKALAAHTDAYKAASDSLERFVDDLKEQIDRGKQPVRVLLDQRDRARSRLAELKKQGTAVDQELAEVVKGVSANNAEVAQLSADKLAYEFGSEITTHNVLGACILALIGLLTAYWGLWSWYFKVQVFQDRALRLEAENARGPSDKALAQADRRNALVPAEGGAPWTSSTPG